mgnify:CR=1 FL=1
MTKTNEWGRASPRLRPDLDSACLKTPTTTFLQSHIDVFNFLLIIVITLSCLPLCQEGTTARDFRTNLIYILINSILYSIKYTMIVLVQKNAILRNDCLKLSVQGKTHL